MDRRKLLLLPIILWGITVSFKGYGQNYVFAKLQGNPLNTQGWNLVGDATVGTTAGNPVPGSQDELILVDVQNNRSGAAFFNTPVNITYCQRWVAEFDYRIWGGTGADGIAFCFLANPPTGFVRGGGMGIPGNAQGLVVGLDPWNNGNCYGQSNPELQIRYCTNGYSECPQGPPQPTLGPLTLIRQANYNRMKITYDNGNIEVYINNQFYLWGFYMITYTGYFGFTASTGGSTDQHSIKDFSLYTYKPILSPPNAGNDITICSDTPSPLGLTPPLNDPYTYRWYPTSGLSDPTIANPTITLSNPTRVPRTLTYFLTKDTLNGVDSVCAYSDAVTVTVLGKGAGAGPDLQLCSGVGQTLNVAQVTGYSYVWAPSIGLSNPFRANPTIRLINNSDTVMVRRYILTATNSARGCIDSDTLMVFVQPSAANAGPDRSLCSKGEITLGTPQKPNFNYSWSPSTGLDFNNVAQPKLRLQNNGTSALTFTYILSVFSQTANCTQNDTIRITLYPEVRPQAALSDTLTYCVSKTNRLGSGSSNSFSYRWWPKSGLSDSLIAQPTLSITPDSQLITFRKYYLQQTNLLSRCSGIDSVVVKVLPKLKSVFKDKDTSVCPYSLISFNLRPSFVTDYEWYYNGNLLSRLPSFKHQTPSGGILGQTDTLVLIKVLEGCRQSDTLLLALRPDLQVNAGRSIGLCIGDSVNIGEPPQVGYTYSWSPTSGLSNPNISNPKLGILASAPQVVNYVLTAQKDGCERKDTLQIILRVKPNSLLPNYITLCSGEPTRIPNFNLTGYTYQWQVTDGLDNPNQANPIITLQNYSGRDSTFVYTVRVSDGLGCTVFDTVGIILKSALSFDLGPIQTICAESPTPLGPNGQANYAYSWSPGWLLNDSTLAQPLFTAFNQTGSPNRYSFTVKATYLPTGCSSIDTLWVSVLSKPIYQFPDTLKACNNSPLVLPLTIPQGYNLSWQAHPFLNTLNPNQPIFNPQLVSTTERWDIIRVTLSNGTCSYPDSIIIHTLLRPDSLSIYGRSLVCPGIQNSAYFVRNLPIGHTANWFVQFGSITRFSQRGDTVYLNWGTLNINGKLLVSISSPNGCSSDTTQLTIIGGTITAPKPEAIIPADSICINNALVRVYEVRQVPFSNYQWRVIGGTIAGSSTGNRVTVNWNSIGYGKLWVEETSTTPLATCLGIGDTLKVKILEGPALTNQLVGPSQVCMGDTVWYSLPPNFNRSMLSHSINGGTLILASNGQFKVVWPYLGSGSFSYQEFFANGCQGQTFVTNISISPKPITSVIRSINEVCAENRQNHRYTVSASAGTIGPKFSWTIIGGTFRSASTDSSNVWVDWDSLASERTLVVNQTNALGCKALSVTFKPVFNSNTFKPDFVSTDESGIPTLFFEGTGVSQNLSIQRKRLLPKPEINWGRATSASTPRISWADSKGGADTAIWSYLIKGFNACGFSKTFGVVENLWLNGPKKIEGPRTDLGWNLPQGWLYNIVSFELWWQPNGGSWQKYQSYSKETQKANFDNLPGGANQCFRLKALLLGGKEAWSNLLCPNFRLNPEPANVFSPNGDGSNDYWLVKNLDLYPENSVVVTDRWGREVYKASPYKNDWNGSNVPSGTYFYLFTTPEGKKANGWLEILK